MVAEPEAQLGALLGMLPESSRGMGKVRSAHDGPVGDYVAPTGAAEAAVAGIWGELMGRERVGVTENFFELGGQSLLATQLVSRVRDAFQMQVPVRALFKAPTVAEFVDALRAMEPKPGHVDRVARIRERVEAMSLEEVRATSTARESSRRTKVGTDGR
jgi:acyl carrier protein